MGSENTHEIRQNAENNHLGDKADRGKMGVGMTDWRTLSGTLNPGGADSGEVWVELCRRGLQTPTLFKTKIAHFATLLSGESRGGAQGATPPAPPYR